VIRWTQGNNFKALQESRTYSGWVKKIAVGKKGQNTRPTKGFNVHQQVRAYCVIAKLSRKQHNGWKRKHIEINPIELLETKRENTVFISQGERAGSPLSEVIGQILILTTGGHGWGSAIKVKEKAKKNGTGRLNKKGREKIGLEIRHTLSASLFMESKKSLWGNREWDHVPTARPDGDDLCRRQGV